MIFPGPLPVDESEYYDRLHEASAPPATEADAHREWHRNAEVPIGLGACPWDACDPASNYDPDDFDSFDEFDDEEDGNLATEPAVRPAGAPGADPDPVPAPGVEFRDKPPF